MYCSLTFLIIYISVELDARVDGGVEWPRLLYYKSAGCFLSLKESNPSVKNWGGSGDPSVLLSLTDYPEKKTKMSSAKNVSNCLVAFLRNKWVQMSPKTKNEKIS